MWFVKNCTNKYVLSVYFCLATTNNITHVIQIVDWFMKSNMADKREAVDLFRDTWMRYLGKTVSTSCITFCFLHYSNFYTIYLNDTKKLVDTVTRN